MKKILVSLLLLTMIMSVVIACDNTEEMSMREKIRYADILYFELHSYIDGYWYSGHRYIEVGARADPNHRFYANFYTEVRFVRHLDEVDRLQNTVIFVYASEDALQIALNVLNWEIDVVGVDVSEFGLEYPLTVENLIYDYESVNEVIWYDRPGGNFFKRISELVRRVHREGPTSRIEYELMIRGEWTYENVEKVSDILEQLNMTETEGGRLLRSAWGIDTFVAVTDLMLEQGLSAEDALALVDN